MTGTLRHLTLALVLGAAAGGCAEWQNPGPVTPTGPRTAPDDSDLWNLAPATAEVVVEVDLAALRASPWTRTLTEGGLSDQRDESRRLFGYDPLTEGDRLLVAGTAVEGRPVSLTVMRGRFDPARVGTAFTTASPTATTNRWRESPLWEADGKAVALVTPQTLVAGSPEGVRAAIDAAWGIVPDARSGSLGAIRRSLGADQPGHAVFVAVTLTDAMRARAAGLVELPPGLLEGAARLDLGDDLNLELFAGLDTIPDAVAAAATGNLALQAYGQNQVVRLLGLAPLLQGLLLVPEGVRVHGHLRVPAEGRDGLGDKLLAVIKMVGAARP